MLAMAPLDIQYHGTYFVVAHFHYVLVAGSLFALFSGWYYWSPKWTGWMYNETRGKIHFWASMIFFNLAFLPMHFVGLAGMPRRYADYPAQFTDWNQVIDDRRVRFRSGAGVLPVRGRAAGVPRRWRAEKAGDKPWDGATASNGPCRARRRSTRSNTRRPSSKLQVVADAGNGPRAGAVQAVHATAREVRTA